MAKPSSSESKSSLKTGAERFLSQLVAHAVDNGFRSADDFLRQFKPLDLMQSLEPAPELRKQILVQAAGMHEKIARKKSTQSAAEDLRIALEEGLTTPADILALVTPDERVRYLDRGKLFTFAVEDGFHAGQKSGAEHERAVDRMVFLLETALAEGLLTVSQLIDAIGYETIAQRLPMKELQRVVEHALRSGRSREPLSDEAFLGVVTLKALVSYVPLDHTWKEVVVPHVARAAELGEAAGKVDTSSREAPPKNARARSDSRPPPKPEKAAAQTNGKKQTDDGAKGDVDLRAAEEEVDNLLEATDKEPAPEEDARRRVVDRLTAINRLPPRHADLTTPILLSIDSMYAELLSASTDEAREEAIRDSFPNEQHMASALLALIELLDGSIDVNDPVIRDADIDSLIKVVLFEERHRYEQAHPSQRVPSPPSGGAPPLPAPSRRTIPPIPPPLPRSASPAPPPLPNEKPR